MFLVQLQQQTIRFYESSLSSSNGSIKLLRNSQMQPNTGNYLSAESTGAKTSFFGSQQSPYTLQDHQAYNVHHGAPPTACNPKATPVQHDQIAVLQLPLESATTAECQESSSSTYSGAPMSSTIPSSTYFDSVESHENDVVECSPSRPNSVRSEGKERKTDTIPSSNAGSPHKPQYTLSATEEASPTKPEESSGHSAQQATF